MFAKTSSRSSLSDDYRERLFEKQKLRFNYGVTEKQLIAYYKEAKRMPGATGTLLLQLLEARLDSVIYRANFVPTMFAARQFISHKHIEVNGKIVNIASYQLKIGDVVTIKEKSRDLLIVLETMQKKERDIPDYLEVDYKQCSVKLLSLPGLSDVPYACIMEPHLVVEYYSA